MPFASDLKASNAWDASSSHTLEMRRLHAAVPVACALPDP